MTPSPYRVASRHLAARLDLSKYDYAAVTAQDVLDTIGNLRGIMTSDEYEVTPGRSRSFDEDMAKVQTPRASILNRAWLWSLDEFSRWLEGFAAVDRIDALRKVVEEQPLLILVSTPKGKVVSRQPGTQDDLERMQELSKDPGYSAVRGMVVTAEPLNKNPLVKKLRELEAIRDQRLRDYAHIYQSLRAQDAQVTVERSTNTEVLVDVSAWNVTAGGMQATRMGRASDGKDVANASCLDDLKKLAAEHGEGDVWMVWHSVLHPFLRGRHLGSQMYDALLDEIGKKGKPAYLMANRCFTAAGGDLTTDDAKRVWGHLRSRYPSSGFVVVVK